MSKKELDLIEKERHEQLIEIVGVHLEKEERRIEDVQRHDITIPRLKELESSNHIRIIDEEIEFTKKGEREFLDLIRRHRLTERLMHDVLDLTEEEGVKDFVCKVEHILTSDVTDSICTLLGHPTICPHGRPIPKGRCCEINQQEIRPIITQANHLKPGESGIITFISTADHDKMDRLASMGLVPGVEIKLHQLKPAVVLIIGETVLSMDTDYASAVYVRRKNSR
ncbi:metal-dependent transcriptional regulator [bacterium]|nr:metal-dependent transcriptional regulator [FCB group bacterium]MBL7190368.1 metal-dependent transcriptional regulator [bacterium]